MTYIQFYVYLVDRFCKSWSTEFTAGQVRQELNMPKSTFNYYMKNMIQEGLITRKMRGRYEICNSTWWTKIRDHVDVKTRYRD